MTEKQKEAIATLNRLTMLDLRDPHPAISEYEYYLLMDFIVPDKGIIKQEVEKKQEVTIPTILDLKLEDSGMSVRTLNCLRGADIKTIGDLVKCNVHDVLKMRNVGRNTLTEVQGFLARYGLKLRMDATTTTDTDNR